MGWIKRSRNFKQGRMTFARFSKPFFKLGYFPRLTRKARDLLIRRQHPKSFARLCIAVGQLIQREGQGFMK